MSMDAQEINSALLEAARQGMLGILDEEINLGYLLSDLPDNDLVLPIIRKRLGLGADDALPADLSKEQIIDIADAIRMCIGEVVSEAFKEAVKQPKLLKALKTLFSTHKENFSSLEPVLSKRYAGVLLDFAEQYIDTPNWKQTQSLIIVAESLVRNVTGTAKPRLFARLDVDWGIYLWKCGHYSEAEKKFEKANAGITELIKKHEKEITDQSEITKNKELQVRILMGFGALYGDIFQDKSKAIGYYNDCLSKMSKMEGTYKLEKMRTSIMNNLGVLYHRMSEQFPEEKGIYLTESIVHFEEGLSVARSIKFTRMEGWLLFNAGEIYALTGQIDKAEQYSEASRKIYSMGKPNERGLSGVEMLDAIIQMEREDYQAALESINRSIALREKAKEPRRIADALDLRGDILMASGEKEGATEDYRNAHAIYESIGSVTGIERTEGKLAALN
jgi:tetratricopeptide (TPR) repeat protein